MDKLKYVKIENDDGSLSENIPIGVDAKNVDVNIAGGSENLQTNLESKQTQIDSLKTQTQNNTTSIAANASAINIEKSRIDNLAQLEEGSTTGDAELIDIRAGFDGTNYNSAGNAVRQQIENLNNKDILLEETKLDLKITDFDYIYHTYVNKNGKIYTSEEGTQFYNTFKSTDYIETKGWKYLYLKNTFHYGDDGIGFYDKDKNGITGAGYATRVGENNKYVLLEIPTIAKYFRSSSFTAESTEFYFAKTISSLNEMIDETHQRIDSLHIEDIKVNEVEKIKSTSNFINRSHGAAYEYDPLTDSLAISSGWDTRPDYWLALDSYFVPEDWNSSFVIELDLVDLGSQVNHLSIWVADGQTGYVAGKCENLQSFNSTGHIKLIVDPAYYTVYYDPAWTKFQVWLCVNRSDGTINEPVTVSNVRIYNVDSEWNNLSGETSEEFFRDIDSFMSETNLEIDNIKNKPMDIKLVAPNSNKYEINVNNDGTIVGAKMIPDTSMFIGNSLLKGSGYGMAASDEFHDYYYLINNFISNKNNNYVANKIAGTDLEALTDPNNINSVVTALTNQLTGNEDLVVIQLGDNVNTNEKVAVFPESSLAFCKAIREKCPKARVVWMGMWYGSTVKYEAIQNACNETGCHYISFIGLTGSDANSAIGNIQKKTLATRTLNNVSNVTEDGNSIVVTFTVSDKSYTSTIPVNDYSLNGTTLNYTSEYDVITNGGVASHPGDEGFRRIANRFLYEMGLTTEEEYYPQEN